jgi:hypothetical protein
MDYWSDSEHRMLSVMESKDRPKTRIEYYLCCFTRKRRLLDTN